MTKLERIHNVLCSMAEAAVEDAKEAKAEGDELSHALHNETAQAYCTAADIVRGFIEI